MKVRRRRMGRSLAKKFFLFTATLVFWVIAVMLAYDLRADSFDLAQGLLLCVIVVLVSGAIARFTSHALTRPLSRLSEGIIAVQRGELETIEVSNTKDEVQFLAESFNEMIRALSESREELRRAGQAQAQALAKLSEQLCQQTPHAEPALDQTLEGQQAESLRTLLNHLTTGPQNERTGRVRLPVL